MITDSKIGVAVSIPSMPYVWFPSTSDPRSTRPVQLGATLVQLSLPAAVDRLHSDHGVRYPLRFPSTEAIAQALAGPREHHLFPKADSLSRDRSAHPGIQRDKIDVS